MWYVQGPHYTHTVIVADNSLGVPMCFQYSPGFLCVCFACLCVGLGVALLALDSTLLSASAHHLSQSLHLSHQFISLQYIYLSSHTRCLIIESTSVVTFAPGLVSRVFLVGCVLTVVSLSPVLLDHNSPDCLPAWLPLCLPAL